MDLRRFGEVIWRFRLLVAAGLLLGLILAAVSLVKLDSGGVSYRQAETYGSDVTLFVTTRGFPWGRTLVETESGELGTASGEPVPDTGRLPTLALIYANLANGDPVKTVIEKTGPLQGSYFAEVYREPRTGGGGALPLVLISAVAESPAGARETAGRAAEGFREYLELEQDRTDIPEDERTVIQILNEPSEALLIEGRSFTRPVVLFLTIAIVFVGLAFVLDNLRPRPTAGPSRASRGDDRHGAERRAARGAPGVGDEVAVAPLEATGQPSGPARRASRSSA